MSQKYTPKYTWEFRQDSLLLRYYSFVWGLDSLRADFCKLFWSVVLAPIGVFLILPGRIIGTRIGRLVLKLVNYLEARSAARPSRPIKVVAEKPPKPAKIKVGPSWPERILRAVANFASNPTVRFVATVLFWILMVVCGLTAIGIIIWFVVNHIIRVLIVIGIASVATTVILGLVLLVRIHEKNSKPRTGPSKVKIFFNGLGRKIAIVLYFLVDGIYAVKTNTCPRIVVYGDPKSTDKPAPVTS